MTRYCRIVRHEEQKAARKNLSSSKQAQALIQIIDFATKSEFADALRRTVDQIVSKYGEQSEVLSVGRNNFDIQPIEGNLIFRVKTSNKETVVLDRKYPNLRHHSLKSMML